MVPPVFLLVRIFVIYNHFQLILTTVQAAKFSHFKHLVFFFGFITEAA